MSIVLLYAGATFSFDLVAKLRELHEDERASTLAQIKRRTDNGVPLDGLTDPGNFVERPALEGLRVSGVVLPAPKFRELDAAHDDAVSAYHRGRAAGLPTGPLADAIYDAKKELVAAAVTSIDGLGIVGDFRDTAVIDALERVGLILPLFRVAAHMQGLAAKKA